MLALVAHGSNEGMWMGSYSFHNWGSNNALICDVSAGNFTVSPMGSGYAMNVSGAVDLDGDGTTQGVTCCEGGARHFGGEPAHGAVRAWLYGWSGMVGALKG